MNKPVISNNALGYTPFSNLLTELNVALAGKIFRPNANGVEHIRPASGAFYYEWRTMDGWLVKCRSDDVMIIEWVGEKGL